MLSMRIHRSWKLRHKDNEEQWWDSYWNYSDRGAETNLQHAPTQKQQHKGKFYSE